MTNTLGKFDLKSDTGQFLLGDDGKWKICGDCCTVTYMLNPCPVPTSSASNCFGTTEAWPDVITLYLAVTPCPGYSGTLPSALVLGNSNVNPLSTGTCDYMLFADFPWTGVTIGANPPYQYGSVSVHGGLSALRVRAVYRPNPDYANPTDYLMLSSPVVTGTAVTWSPCTSGGGVSPENNGFTGTGTIQFGNTTGSGAFSCCVGGNPIFSQSAWLAAYVGQVVKLTTGGCYTVSVASPGTYTLLTVALAAAYANCGVACAS